MNDREILMEIMFRALIEIRAEAADAKCAKAFHLADMFHHLPRELALGVDEGDILRQLHERAGMKGIQSWLDHATAEVTKNAAMNSA